MKEKTRQPAAHDPRLRILLPQLESLPEELRDALVSVLEGVVRTHQILEGYQGGGKGPLVG
jgi:hypothetical protein